MDDCLEICFDIEEICDLIGSVHTEFKRLRKSPDDSCEDEILRLERLLKKLCYCYEVLVLSMESAEMESAEDD